VRTLLLLELALLSVPSGEAFLQQAGPAFEAYGNGDHEGAFALFMSVVSGLDRAACLAVLEASMPGSVALTIKDADTFFGIALPSLGEWVFGAAQASAIHCPVLSVRGTDTLPMFVEVGDFLRSSLPNVEECMIDGVGHLLHIQNPRSVAHAMAKFLGRNCIAGH
jgi:pimeloyl-ACP methyl ester carboxylesterase